MFEILISGFFVSSVCSSSLAGGERSKVTLGSATALHAGTPSAHLCELIVPLCLGAKVTPLPALS